jgi:hypothetical protein
MMGENIWYLGRDETQFQLIQIYQPAATWVNTNRYCK